MAQNLVGNSGFDTDLSGWTAFEGTPTWSSADCCGNAASGSASLPLVDFGEATLVSDCIDVQAGAAYDLVVLAETLPIPPGALSGSGTATVSWYRAGNPCSNGATLAPPVPGITIPVGTGWRSFGATFTAPSDALAAKVALRAQIAGLSVAIDMHYDNVQFGPTGSVPVTLQSFEVD